MLSSFLILQISISYAHSIGTRVRISLMKSVAKRQREKDPNAVCSVSSFTARPLLRVGGGKDKGTRFLSFVDAMIGFRHLLTQEDIDKAASMCQNLKGHLRSRFLVLSDDKTPPPPPNKKRPHSEVLDDEAADHLQPLHQRGKRFQNQAFGSSRSAPSPSEFAANQLPLLYPQLSQSSFPPLQANPPLNQSAFFSMLAQSSTSNAPPPGTPVQTPILAPPVLVHQAVLHHPPPPCAVPDNSGGFQTVSGRGSRRQSQRLSTVAGVQKISPSNQSGKGRGYTTAPVDEVRATGLTEDLEDEERMNEDNSDSSTATMVDAVEIL